MGNIWVGTWADGVFVLDRDGNVGRPKIQDPTAALGSSVLGIHEDLDGTLWFASWGGGATRYRPENGTIETLRHDADNEATLASDRVLEIFRDRRGVLWLGTWGGLNKLPVRKPFHVLRRREGYRAASQTIAFSRSRKGPTARSGSARRMVSIVLSPVMTFRLVQ